MIIPNIWKTCSKPPSSSLTWPSKRGASRLPEIPETKESLQIGEFYKVGPPATIAKLVNNSNNYGLWYL